MEKQRNYTFDFKVKLVLEEVDGHGSLRTVSRDAGINRRTLTHWVNLYNMYGEEALKWKKRSARSMEEKIDLVLAYRGSNLSLSQAAAQFGLVGSAALKTWNNQMKEDKELFTKNLKIGNEVISQSLNREDRLKPESKKGSHTQKLEDLSKEELIHTLRDTLAQVSYLKKLKALTLSKLQEKIKVGDRCIGVQGKWEENLPITHY